MMIELVPIVCCTQSPPASPDYVPVSHDWLALCLEAGGTGQKGAVFLLKIQVWREMARWSPTSRPSVGRYMLETCKCCRVA
jgi:hypothetical protein